MLLCLFTSWLKMVMSAWFLTMKLFMTYAFARLSSLLLADRKKRKLVDAIRQYVLGYWPSFIFSYLAKSASMIEWGSKVLNSEADGHHTSTPMGSGRRVW